MFQDLCHTGLPAWTTGSASSSSSTTTLSTRGWSSSTLRMPGCTGGRSRGTRRCCCRWGRNDSGHADAVGRSSSRTCAISITLSVILTTTGREQFVVMWWCGKGWHTTNKNLERKSPRTSDHLFYSRPKKRITGLVWHSGKRPRSYGNMHMVMGVPKKMCPAHVSWRNCWAGGHFLAPFLLKRFRNMLCYHIIIYSVLCVFLCTLPKKSRQESFLGHPVV